MPFKSREESIPSMNPTPASRCSAVAGYRRR